MSSKPEPGLLDKNRNPDGTYNGVAVLADLTGLSRTSVKEIAERARENHELLESCSYHDFSPILPRVALNQRYRCIHCCGEVNSQAHFWHQKGRRPEVP